MKEIRDQRCGISSNYEEKYLINSGKVISINIEEGHRTTNRPESQQTNKQKPRKSYTENPVYPILQ